MQHQLNDITIKFFIYFNGQFKSLDRRFKRQDEHIDGLYKLLDAYLKQIEINQQEALIDTVRVRRLEDQIKKLTQEARNQSKVAQL